MDELKKRISDNNPGYDYDEFHEVVSAHFTCVRLVSVSYNCGVLK